MDENTVEVMDDVNVDGNDLVVSDDTDLVVSDEEHELPLGPIALGAGAVVALVGGVVFAVKNRKLIANAWRSGVSAAKDEFKKDKEKETEITDVKVEFVPIDSEESKTNTKK